jgi:hypothetical protein
MAPTIPAISGGVFMKMAMLAFVYVTMVPIVPLRCEREEGEECHGRQRANPKKEKEKEKETHMMKQGKRYDQYRSLVLANGRSILAMNSSTRPPKIVHLGLTYFTNSAEIPAMAPENTPVGRNRTELMMGDQ